MSRTVSADDLFRHAREAAGTRNVRDAVRELTLHALRSRPLTANHIATVARTVGEGIESCDLAPAAAVRETHRGAWDGLEEAVGQALLAVELAARQCEECHAWVGRVERERLVAEIACLEQALGSGWARPGAVPSVLRARLESVRALLRRDPPAGAAGEDDESREGRDGALSFVASGVLVGLSQRGPQGTR